MAHFSLSIVAPSGDRLFATDFTFHELIPLVRQITRKLERNGQGGLQAYRVVLTPRYGSPPPGALSPYDLDEEPVPPVPAASGTDGLIQILEEELDAYVPAFYFDELTAFYSPGTSPLCLDCPERLRCPGAGSRTAGNLTGWIELDSEAPRSDEPIDYLTLRIDDGNGTVLYREDFRLMIFQFFAQMVARLLETRHRLEPPRSGVPSVEIIVRSEGQPRLDPLLTPESRPPVTPTRSPETRVPSRRRTAAAPTEPPRRLVDWDQLDKASPVVENEVFDEMDLEIKVVAVEAEALQDRPMPSSNRFQPIGQVDTSNLRIFLHRTALTSLDAVGKELREEIGGLLVGDAFRHPADARPYVEIMGAIPILDEAGRPVQALSSGNLRTFQDRLKRDFPERRPVGWFRFHLFGEKRIAVCTSDHAIATGIGERLALLEDESFLHRNFFPQPWHVGMIIDAVEGQALFYHMHDGKIVPSYGYFLVD